MTRKNAHPDDPRALIDEAYRIEGLHEADARSIFFDWALGLPAGQDPVAAATRLLEHHADRPTDHPMTQLLRETVETGPPTRSGRRRRREG